MKNFRNEGDALAGIQDGKEIKLTDLIDPDDQRRKAVENR